MLIKFFNLNAESIRWALTPLVLGCLFSFGSAGIVNYTNQHTIDAALVATAESISDEVVEHIRHFQYGLRGARGAILAGGEHEISREKFQLYAQSRDSKAEFPGALGFGFIRRVPKAQEARFLTKARRDGAPALSIRQLQPHDGERAVIQYIEPALPNHAAIGLDIASEAMRRDAAMNALKSGEMRLTGPITLVQKEHAPQQAFLILLPIYRGGATPATIAEREASGFGWSYAPLQMTEILEQLALAPGLLRISIADATDPAHPVTFFRHGAADTATPITAEHTDLRNVYGRNWRLSYTALPPFAHSLHLTKPSSVLAGGLLLSLLLAVTALSLSNNLQRKRQLRNAREELATIVENTLDGIIGKTPQGIITSWNRGAELIFGYTSAEAIGKPLAQLIVPTGMENEENRILAHIVRGEHIDHFQTRRKRKDGTLIDVSVSVAPICDSDGKVVGASKSVRDISAQKHAEAQVLELNATLEEKVALRTAELEIARRNLRTVLDSVPSMIGYWDRQLTNQFANHAYRSWFGVDPEQLKGQSLHSLLGTELFTHNQPFIEAALRGETQTFDPAIPGRDGQVRHSLANFIPDIVDGETQGFYMVVNDITEVVERGLALAHTLRENQLLLSAINEHLLYSVTDLAGNLIDVNDLFCKTIGYRRDELIGKNHRLLNAGHHGAAFWQSMWATISAGKAWRGEICNRTKQGELVWTDSVIAPFLNEAGTIERYIALRIDTTQRKAANAELARLNTLLSSVLRSSTEVAIIATDVDGTISVFNIGAQRMLGYEENDMVGRQTPAIFHLQEEIEARSVELSADFGETIKGFRVFVHIPELLGSEQRQWTYVRKDGTQLTVSLAATAMRDEAGKICGYLGIAIDVTQELQRQRELLAVRDQLLMAAKVANLGVWSWSIPDNSLWWNQNMFDIYAQAPALNNGGLNYEHWRSRVHPDDVVATEACLMAAVAGQGNYDPVFRLLRPDGQIRYIQAGAQIERDAHGQAFRVTGINLDITRIKETEAALLEAKQQAELASQAKGQFLANMSHEIRTPMNAVLGMLQLVQQTKLNIRQQDYVLKAQKAAKSLLGLLNDILDFSKIEAGKLELDLHDFSIEVLLRDLGVILSGTHGQKDVEVLFDLPPFLPEILIGDQLRLQQILVNLAGNALKFTDHGYVIVRVVELVRSDTMVNFCISVSDTGIGMNPEQLQRVFAGFTQAEASTTRRFGGTGLGLVISRRLINLMGGELHVESEPGVGSRFSFELALAISQTKPATKTLLPAALPSDLQVLVVDDNPHSGELLIKLLQEIGWSAQYADSGLDAISLVQAKADLGAKYDLILMDWRMPDMDGVDAARQICNLDALDKPPMIIMVTAYGREILADMENQDDIPFVDFLTKPVTPQQLLSSMLHALGYATPGSAAPPADNAQTKRLVGMRILVVEDNALNRQVASELLAIEGAMVLMAEGGLQGVHMAVATENTIDLILMDMQMPDIDGLEATRRIRADARMAAVPILAMTANAAPTDRAACLAAGMNDHVGKPIDMEEVVPRILALTRGVSVADAPATASIPAADSSLVEPLASRLRRFGMNLEIYCVALEQFRSEGRMLLATMQQQVGDAGTEQNIGASLHALKGISATVGASALATLASELESRAKAGGNGAHRASASAEELQHMSELLEDCATALEASLPVAAPPAAPATTAYSEEIWQTRLQELQALLSAKNMRSLDIVEEIVAMGSPADQPLVGELSAQVQSLQFAAALQTLRRLLEEEN